MGNSEGFIRPPHQEPEHRLRNTVIAAALVLAASRVPPVQDGLKSAGNGIDNLFQGIATLIQSHDNQAHLVGPVRVEAKPYNPSKAVKEIFAQHPDAVVHAGGRFTLEFGENANGQLMPHIRKGPTTRNEVIVPATIASINGQRFDDASGNYTTTTMTIEDFITVEGDNVDNKAAIDSNGKAVQPEDWIATIVTLKDGTQVVAYISASNQTGNYFSEYISGTKTPLNTVINIPTNITTITHQSVDNLTQASPTANADHNIIATETPEPTQKHNK